MKGIGILGASGFIGKNLCNYFIHEALDFVAISRNPDLSSSSVKFSSFKEIPQVEKLIYLSEGNDLKVIESIGEKYIQDSKTNLLETLEKKHFDLIYISSAAVYEDSHTGPLKTSSNLNISSIYSRSKIECEKISLDYGGTVLRLSNVYGEGMSKNNVLSNLIKKFVAKKTRIEVRDSKPIRDYLFIEDLTECLGVLIKKNYNQIFNIGSGKGSSVKDLFESLKLIFGADTSEIIEINPKPRESSIILDIKETKKIINWSPKTSLSKGLELTVKDSL